MGPKIFDVVAGSTQGTYMYNVHCTRMHFHYALPLGLGCKMWFYSIYFFTHNCRLLDRILRVNVTFMVILCVEYADATMNGEFSNHTSLVTAKD